MIKAVKLNMHETFTEMLAHHLPDFWEFAQWFVKPGSPIQTDCGIFYYQEHDEPPYGGFIVFTSHPKIKVMLHSNKWLTFALHNPHRFHTYYDEQTYYRLHPQPNHIHLPFNPTPASKKRLMASLDYYQQMAEVVQVEAEGRERLLHAFMQSLEPFGIPHDAQSGSIRKNGLIFDFKIESNGWFHTTISVDVNFRHGSIQNFIALSDNKIITEHYE